MICVTYQTEYNWQVSESKSDSIQYPYQRVNQVVFNINITFNKVEINNRWKTAAARYFFVMQATSLSQLLPRWVGQEFTQLQQLVEMFALSIFPL